MPDVPASVMQKVVDAAEALKPFLLPPVEPDPKPQPDEAFWVDPVSGDDGNDGRDRKTPFRSLDGATQALKPKTALVLMDGTYNELFRLHDLGTGKDRPVWIKAENPGKAVISGLTQPMSDGQARWHHLGGGLYRTSFPRRPWAGFANDRFLFSYKSVADLKAATIVGRKKPPYGLAWQDQELPNDVLGLLPADVG